MSHNLLVEQEAHDQHSTLTAGTLTMADGRKIIFVGQLKEDCFQGGREEREKRVKDLISQRVSFIKETEFIPIQIRQEPPNLTTLFDKPKAQEMAKLDKKYGRKR